MGWQDSHLHIFSSGSETFGQLDSGPGSAKTVEAKTRLRDVLTKPGQRLSYEYDFGDSWAHDLVLEKILDPEPGGKYPWVVAGKGACPPEDCGGLPGYSHLLAVLAKPKHPERAELVEWLGREFDPDAFYAYDLNAKFHGGWVPDRARLGAGAVSGGPRDPSPRSERRKPARRPASPAPRPRGYVTDMRHFLTEDGLLPEDLPGPAENLVLYIGAIVEWVTRRGEAGRERTNVPCRRRPGHRRCPSFIEAGFATGGGEIEWGCPGCGEWGVVTGWAETFWNRTPSPVPIKR